MTTLTITNTFTAGTTIQSSQMNTNFTDITTWANGNITNNNIGVAASIALSKLDLTAVALNLRASGNNTWASGVTGDTVPRVAMRSEGGIMMGAGSASALDLFFKRNSATEFALRNAADNAFTDLTMGALTLGTDLTVPNGGTGASSFTANTFIKGNGSSALSAHALGTANQVYGINAGASDQEYKTITAGTGIGVAHGVGTITISNTATAGSVQGTCDGRLTLTTALPVTTADVTAATTLYWTPYKGNQIALYNGSTWDIISTAQINIAVPATSAQMYDVFIYNNSGTATLELTAWTNDTTRATALTTQDGVLVKTGVLTRRYIGSFRTTGVSGQTEDSAVKRFLWNYYHRVPTFMTAKDTTDSWTYTTATWREANASTASGVGRTELVIGVAEDEVTASYAVLQANSVNAASAAGIGIDSTSTNSAVVNIAGLSSGPAMVRAEYHGYPAAGYHYVQSLEIATASGTTTWYGDGGLAYGQSGQSVRCFK